MRRRPKGAFKHRYKCRRSPWSTWADETAVAMRRAGRPVKEIARTVKKTPAAVVTRLGKLGVRVTPPTRPWSRAEDAQLITWRMAGVKSYTIGRRLDRTASAVGHRIEYLALPPLKHAWKRGTLSKAVAGLHAQGLTDPEIAAALKADKSSVADARKRQGLPANITYAEAGRLSGAARRKKAEARRAGNDRGGVREAGV